MSSNFLTLKKKSIFEIFPWYTNFSTVLLFPPNFSVLYGFHLSNISPFIYNSYFFIALFYNLHHCFMDAIISTFPYLICRFFFFNKAILWIFFSSSQSLACLFVFISCHFFSSRSFWLLMIVLDCWNKFL